MQKTAEAEDVRGGDGDGGRRQETATAGDGRRQQETAGDGGRRQETRTKLTRMRACTQDRLRRIHGQDAHDLNANSGPDADAGPGTDASPDAHAGFSCVFCSCAAVRAFALQPPGGNQVDGLPPVESIYIYEYILSVESNLNITAAFKGGNFST